MRSARIVIVGMTAAAILALAVVAVAQRTSLAFTLGVAPAAAVARLGPGEQACQRPIDVPAGAAFDRVALGVGTSGRPGPPLRLTVRAATGGGVLASGALAGGYADVARRPVARVRLDRTVDASQRVTVCVENRGPGRVGVYGDVDLAARTSTAVKDGRPLRRDLSLVFERAPRSVASEVPAMLER
ncbi:MAG TPA: hypothetical protein VHF51_15515, partial [Solirubrobacteraceae bacterium]|nr:hypothetical protein [Solirubrobacteraceae bacterium]